jgi:hypothetical protein
VVVTGDGATGNEGVCRASIAGVAEREGVLKARGTPLVGEPARELVGLRNSSLEGLADTLRLESESENLGGDRGESTVTRGGDLGGDIGPIDTGRNFGVPERDVWPSP